MSFSWFKNLQSRQKRGLILLFVSFFCFSAIIFLKGYQTLQKNFLSFSQAPTATGEIEEGDLPEKIIIAKIGIDLPVFPAEVADNQWQTSAEGASYLLGSGIPGQKGNVVIYGHNKSHLLGPIKWLNEGEEIKVINRKGEEFVYQVVETKTVTPKNVEVLDFTEEATLTLYTCTGFLDRERFVVVAKLQLE